MGDTTIQPEGGVTPVVPVAPVAATTAPASSQTTPETQPQPQVPTSPLPEGASERTAERFEKLTEANKRLYEANQLLQRELNRKAQLEQQVITPQQQVPFFQPPKMEEYIETDPVTGEQIVNSDKLKRVIAETNQRAIRAETAINAYKQQQDQLNEQRQTEEAYAAYPELDPAALNFDADLSKDTRRFLVDSWMHPTDYKGRALTFKEAADLAKGRMKQPTVSVTPTPPPAVSKENKENLENKQQATLSVQGVSSTVQPTTPNPDESLTDLQMRSRRGDMWAIAERLAKTPHTGTPKSSET